MMIKSLPSLLVLGSITESVLAQTNPPPLGFGGVQVTGIGLGNLELGSFEIGETPGTTGLRGSVTSGEGLLRTPGLMLGGIELGGQQISPSLAFGATSFFGSEVEGGDANADVSFGGSAIGTLSNIAVGGEGNAQAGIEPNPNEPNNFNFGGIGFNLLGNEAIGGDTASISYPRRFALTGGGLGLGVLTNNALGGALTGVDTGGLWLNSAGPGVGILTANTSGGPADVVSAREDGNRGNTFFAGPGLAVLSGNSSGGDIAGFAEEDNRMNISGGSSFSFVSAGENTGGSAVLDCEDPATCAGIVHGGAAVGVLGLVDSAGGNTTIPEGAEDVVELPGSAINILALGNILPGNDTEVIDGP